ncbi:MAG: FecR domain-containing protein [Planctomycetaceae bacterium]
MNEPTAHTELDRLLNASVDGELSDSDESTLQALLRDDAAARRRYLQFMQLHAELHWDHGAAASLLVTPEHEPSEFRREDRNARFRIGGWMLLAVAMGTLAAGWLMAVAYFHVEGQTSPASTPIARLELTHGTVSFQSTHGESLDLSGRGQTLPAGSLLLEGESAAQWRFLDGTLITVSGDAEVTFSDDGQKLLRVRHGILTAEVEPQPSGVPLVVETPTARVEVLGTVFTLATESDQTRINVVEGRVRLKRLVDGETVEVPSEHSCVASLDARGELQPKVPDRPAIGWQHRFAEPPPNAGRANGCLRRGTSSRG